MIFRLLLLFFFIRATLAVGQASFPFSQEINFVNYLIDNEAYPDAIYLLKKLNTASGELTPERKDSLNYLLGWSYYNIKSIDSSIKYLNKVSLESPHYFKSKFYQAFENIYSGKNEEAGKLLQALSITSPEHQQLKVFELAGIALLEKDFERFDSLQEKFTYSYYPIVTEQQEFISYYKELRSIKKKSPLLAGLMSAVIPGSGKFYAGYKGQGLSSFLTVSTMGAVAAESFLKAGPSSPQFIIFASIFSAFYIGNIWGSTLSVNIKRNEQYNEIRHNIMLDLHIPLRRAFN